MSYSFIQILQIVFIYFGLVATALGGFMYLMPWTAGVKKKALQLFEVGTMVLFAGIIFFIANLWNKLFLWMLK